MPHEIDDNCDDQLAFERSIEPEDDLPGGLLQAVILFVFSNLDEHAARGSADVLEALCVVAGETEAESVEELIIASDDLRILKVESGTLTVEQEQYDESVELAAELCSALDKSVFGADPVHRIKRVQALEELANRWVSLFIDYEKLVGHLVLRYGLTGVELTESPSFFESLKARILQSPIPPKPTYFGR